MNNIIIITAPSAAGKTTLIKKYVSEHKNAEFCVSHTTRAKRGDEADGKDYHFIDKEKFNEMIVNGDFIEWALVHDNYYGTSSSEINKPLNDGNILILDVDVQGALLLKKRELEAKYIFIMPPSIEEIKERLRKRNTEPEESIKLRIWNAKREIEYSGEFDHVIKNEDLITAYKELEASINGEEIATVVEANVANTEPKISEKIDENILENKDDDISETAKIDSKLENK